MVINRTTYIVYSCLLIISATPFRLPDNRIRRNNAIAMAPSIAGVL